jgi:hypothetical protein
MQASILQNGKRTIFTVYVLVFLFLGKKKKKLKVASNVLIVKPKQWNKATVSSISERRS